VSFTYLGLLAFSIAGLGLIDWRLGLAFFGQPLRALLTIVIPTSFFLIWDASGIALGIFFKGQTQLLTGVMLAPEIPLEEPFFLLLLCYTTLILFLSFDRRGQAK
jgi:lycopene cyclase domain-containing protein